MITHPQPELSSPSFGAFKDLVLGFGDRFFSVDKLTGKLNW